MDAFNFLADIAVGLAAFKLAWSVDRTQKGMLLVQEQQSKILQEFGERLAKIEEKLK